MNLTSKRMLQFLSVCVGAFALTASAQTTWVSDNFEKEGAGLTNASPGDAAGMYKAHVWGAMDQWTNLVWEAGAGDASTIQEVDSTYLGNSRPIADDNAKKQALKLETEGQTLTRYVAFQNITDGTDTAGIPLTAPTNIPMVKGGAPVYVDTLMKFTPSEDDPEVTDPYVKLALFVNASSNLVLRHSYFDNDAGIYVVTNSVFDADSDTPIEIDPEKWYRLTIEMRSHASYGDIQVLVWLDGNPLVHYNGETEGGGAHNGPVFWAMHMAKSLSQISFQGTGYVDDLVVTDTIVPFQTAGTTLTLVFNDNLLNVFDIDNASVASNATITSGATLKIYTEDWYQINSIGGDGIEWTGDTPSELVTNVTGTISADVAGRTATIEAGLYTGTIQTGLTGTYATVPADKLASWAVANSLTLADVVANAADYLDNYLMNVGVGVDTGIEITSIVYDPTTEKAKITVEATDPNVNFNGLNGTLTVWTSDDLTTLGSTTGFSRQINEAGTVATFVVDEVAGKFIRARVE